MFVVAHISDLHFNGTRFNRARIQSTLSYINARATGIDVLLVTGDIADEGAASEYREAYGVLESPLPMLITAGNHDAYTRGALPTLSRVLITCSSHFSAGSTFSRWPNSNPARPAASIRWTSRAGRRPARPAGWAMIGTPPAPAIAATAVTGSGA